MHGDAVFRHLENARQLLPQRKRVLAGRPDFDPVGTRIRQRRKRLQVIVMHARKSERVGEHVIAGVKRGCRAGRVVELVANILARAQRGRRAGAIARHYAHRCGVEQGGCVVLQRCLNGGQHGQVFVADLHQRERRGGFGFSVGRHGTHDVADITHLVDRDNRLILDEVAVHRHVVRRNIGMGEYGTYPRCGSRAADIEPGDARMGARRAQHFGMQHAGQCGFGRISGAAA